MRFFLLVAAFSLVAAAPVSATVRIVTFQPGPDASKDAGIWEEAPDVNFGDDDTLWLGWANGWTDSLIKFNALDGYMGATPLYAELGLYVYDDWGPLGDDNRVARVDGAWDEDTVTWDNSPGWNDDMYVVFDAPPVGDWLGLDVTDIVDSWLNDGFPHHGFYLLANYTVDEGVYIWSGEHTDPDLRPYLHMEYSYTGVAPASLGEIKAGFR
jgi:hypothetical protein